MITLNELKTVHCDAQNSDMGTDNEPGFIYWLWPAQDDAGRHVIVRINGDALSEISGIKFGLASHSARRALLKCRDQIQAAVDRKVVCASERVSVEREDFLTEVPARRPLKDSSAERSGRHPSRLAALAPQGDGISRRRVG